MWWVYCLRIVDFGSAALAPRSLKEESVTGINCVLTVSVPDEEG